jgi:CHAT domain-containing protein/tetratricopeptide (TPR) repeat protein
MPAATYSREALIDFNISVSILYMQMPVIQKAILYLNKANALFPQTVFNIFTKTELNNAMALALMAAGQKDSAEIMLKDLIRDLEKLNMKTSDGYYLTVINLCDVYIVNNKSKKADSILTAAIIATKGKRNKYVGGMYMTLALVKVKNAEYEAGIKNIDTALSIINEYAKDDLQYTLPARILKSTFLLKLQRNSEAYIIYNDVMSDFTKNIRQNINHLTELEKNSLLLSYYNMANFGQSFLTPENQKVTNSNTKKIWEQQLFFKGLAANRQGDFLDELRHSKDSSVRILYNEWQELLHYIQAQLQLPVKARSKNLDSLTLLTERKEKQLMLYLPGLNKSSNSNTVESIYKNLRPGEALVDFTHYSRITTALVDSLWYGAFILQYGKPDPAFVNICSDEQLNSLLNFPALAGPTGYQQNQLYPSTVLNHAKNLPGNRLYKLIWKPLQPYFKGVKTIYIIADGSLYKIAFHVLPTDLGGYVCDQFDIRYLYHASALCDSGFRIHKKPAGVQVWGGIRYDSIISVQETRNKNTIKGSSADVKNNESIEPDWSYLPGTANEAAGIVRMCIAKNISCKLYSGMEATEQSFKQNFGNNYDIVHIATHGQFDSGYFSRKQEFRLFSNLPFTLLKDPMKQVALIMAGRNTIKSGVETNAQEHDGLLDAGEVARLGSGEKQLVVLSACESGRGDIISAEGVYGMVRAFKMAGVRRILISLWKVPDEQTKEMILVFYKKLLNGLPETTAIKNAQQYMRKKYPPYFWGGFILVE